ncbi:TPA: hypothetical protein ACFRGQ_001119 [Neisseria lactamica]
MKHTLLAVTGAIFLLGACSSRTYIKTGKPEDIAQIKHICIIPNSKSTPPAYHQELAASLSARGISSETVTLGDRRLYSPECKYNLRYHSTGNTKQIKKISVLIRTPQYEVKRVKYTTKNSDDTIGQQTDAVVSLLLAH